MNLVIKIPLAQKTKEKERMSENKRKFQKKRVKKEGRSYFRSPQKYECHSHIAPFDKKEWHSSFAPYFGSGAQEWRSGAALKRVPLFNTL